MTLIHPVRIAVLGLLEVVGNSASDITVNFWLDSFVTGTAANFTVLLLSAVFYVAFIIPLAVLIWYRRRADHVSRAQDQAVPSRPELFFSFFRDRTNCILVLLLAIADVAVDVFGTYAAGHIPVLVQVVLKAAEPLVCWALSCLVWRGAYTKLSFLLILPSVSLIIAAGGVVAETWLVLKAEQQTKSSVSFWIGMYTMRVVGSAVYNVVQGTLMRRNSDRFCEERSGERGAPRYVHNNKLLLSVTILSCDALLSLVLILALGPALDTISHAGWGTSDSVAAAWTNFGAGAACVANLNECPNNLWFALATNGAWSGVYIVDSFLNEASPALNSLMNMLGSPATSLLLIVFPSLNLWSSVERSSTNIALQIGGVVLLTVSVVLFYQYETRKTAKVHDGVFGERLQAEGQTHVPLLEESEESLPSTPRRPVHMS